MIYNLLRKITILSFGGGNEKAVVVVDFIVSGTIDATNPIIPAATYYINESGSANTVVASKGINITGHYHIIPFVDMFYKNMNSHGNLEEIISENEIYKTSLNEYEEKYLIM